MPAHNVKVDSKGRVMIPGSFREILGIKEGENIVAQLDKENERLILFPVEKKTKRMQIFIADVPGALARTAAVLAKNNVDLVYTSSVSIKRKREALWEIIADFSNVDMKKLQKSLKAEKSVAR